MIINIPIEIVKLDDNSFHLFVDGQINGQLCSFILDTGASKTVFALNHIRPILTEMPVIQPDIQSAGISASTFESYTGTIGSFSLGGLLISNMSVIFIDLSMIDELYRKITDRSIWGLIGSDMLVDYKAKLDYGRKVLSLKVPRFHRSKRK
jgi:hypothetical protein